MKILSELKEKERTEYVVRVSDINYKVVLSTRSQTEGLCYGFKGVRVKADTLNVAWVSNASLTTIVLAVQLAKFVKESTNEWTEGLKVVQK